MDFATTICFLAGFVLLILGAELLVRGASSLAEIAGISPLVVGLTVVAYGTSAPELAVTIQAVHDTPPRPDLVIGNIVGSNISNVLLVLGISATCTPLVVSRQLVRQGIPVMIGACLAVLVMGLDGTMSRWDGLILVACAIGYTGYMLRESRRERAAKRVKDDSAPDTSWPGTRIKHTVLQVVYVLAGLALLILGANWLVAGAVALSTYLGLSQLIVGLTVIAVGTSLPEIATSIIAGIRGQRDIAVGNVVGSNIFNVLLVLGTTAMVSPSGVTVSTSALHFDIPIMIAVAAACFPVFFTGYRIARWEGFLFLVYYCAYTLFLILKAAQHAALDLYSGIMLSFVLPLTAVTLVVLTISAMRSKREPTNDGTPRESSPRESS